MLLLSRQTSSSKMLINLTEGAAMLDALIWNSNWWTEALRGSQGEVVSYQFMCLISHCHSLHTRKSVGFRRGDKRNFRGSGKQSETLPFCCSATCHGAAGSSTWCTLTRRQPGSSSVFRNLYICALQHTSSIKTIKWLSFLSYWLLAYWFTP